MPSPSLVRFTLVKRIFLASLRFHFLFSHGSQIYFAPAQRDDETWRVTLSARALRYDLPRGTRVGESTDVWEPAMRVWRSKRAIRVGRHQVTVLFGVLALFRCGRATVCRRLLARLDENLSGQSSLVNLGATTDARDQQRKLARRSRVRFN